MHCKLQVTAFLLSFLGLSIQSSIGADFSKGHILENPEDHFHVNNTEKWPSRYFVSTKYWKGPGHPIFFKIGGEGGPKTEVPKDFVTVDLAKKFGAAAVQTEHRFYGDSWKFKSASGLPSNKEFKAYLSPDQALEDNIRIIQHVQKKLGCSADGASIQYCPIITVGASYPGFLAVMLRFVYPNVVDIGYGSSAPIKLYSREEQRQYLYFDHVTKVAETASPGCSDAYKKTLPILFDKISSMQATETAKRLGICHSRIPKYLLDGSPKLFAQELLLMIGIEFAHFNMHYYPPGDPATTLIKACAVFQNKDKTPLEKLKDWLIVKAKDEKAETYGCYDLQGSLPSGPNATIGVSDWTGCGSGGAASQAWEYQSCKDWVVPAGFGPESMFLERPFDLKWLKDHCQARFQVDPEPDRMERKWHFTGQELVEGGGSYILFTNGLNDAWSVFSHFKNLSDTMVAINFVNGSHHSEFSLRHETKDILEGRKRIASILREWINIVKRNSQEGDAGKGLN